MLDLLGLWIQLAAPATCLQMPKTGPPHMRSSMAAAKCWYQVSISGLFLPISQILHSNLMDAKDTAVAFRSLSWTVCFSC